MSERSEKLEIAASRATGGATRCRLDQLRGTRWGRVHCKAKPAAGDRIYFEPMGAPELWRVTSIDENGVALEQEDLMTYLQLIRGGGSPEHPCAFCGEVWDGADDTKHGAHNRGALCGHVGIFNCQLKMIEGFCSCPPSGPAYPRQPHEPRYELDTAGNLRKVMVEPAPPPLTLPASSPAPEVQAEPVDHREEVGGFQRGEPCAFQHRFQADGACAVCKTRVPDGCTCAPAGTEKIGYTHAPSCKIQPAAKKKMLIVDVLEGESEDAARDRASLEEIITSTADQAAKLIVPTDGSPPADPGAVLAAARAVVDEAMGTALDQAGIPREALVGSTTATEEERPAETPPWVGLTEDGSGLACQRCGVLEPVPLDLDAMSATLTAFENAHRTCPEKRG